MYRMTGEKAYLERAKLELLYLCGLTDETYPDWHPSHLLDTAMTANGVAIAYDWLYADLTAEEKAQVELAIYTNALEEALRQFTGNPVHMFVTNTENWNYICNGGFITAAMALAHHENEDYNALAGDILQRCYSSIQYGLPQYAPEGASVEGISYWDYGTRYLVSLLATISSATNVENPFLDAPGLNITAEYPIYLSGKAGSYNYSDNDMVDAFGYLNMWLAHTYGESSWNWYHKFYMEKGYDATIYDLLYYYPAEYGGEAPEDLDKWYTNQSVTTMRHDFTDPDSSFLGYKGGWNGAPHGDVDVGSFIYDIYGMRWAEEFGKDDYNLTGYWENGPGGTRWNYYRKNAMGHNTLVFNPTKGANQTVGAYAGKVEQSINNPGGGYTILDMTDAYQDNAVSVMRGFAYLDRTQVLIRDEFTLKASGVAYWQMHTKASVSISDDGKTATLTQGGKTLLLKLVGENANDDLVFASMDATTYPDEGVEYEGLKSNEGYTKVYVKADGVQKAVINVLITPEDMETPEVKTLENWNEYDFSTLTCAHAATTTTTVDATCAADGSTTVTCDDCGETVSTETIPATGEHSYENGSCVNCGEADPDAEPVKFEIVQQPVSDTGTIGETVSVSVIATGEGLTYKWYIRNAGSTGWSVSSITSNTYETVMNKDRANRELYCVITDANGDTLKTDTVMLIGQPTVELKINAQPTDASAKLGEKYCVTVEAQGDRITYQWFFKNKGSSQWHSSSVRDNTYDDVMNVGRAGREVYCVITDAWGNSVTTDTVTLIGLPDEELDIVTQPNNASAKIGEEFVVTVEAVGDGLRYTWYWRQIGSETWNLSSVRDNTYEAEMNAYRHNREVYCVITDAFGNTVTSDIATITGAPTVTLEITKQPEDQTVTLGEMFNVTVEAQGDDIRYQWYFRQKGTERWLPSGQKDNCYDDVMTIARHNRELYCVITDAWGNTVETSPVVVIMAKPTQELAITVQPENTSAKMGEEFCVTVEAQGDGLQYQWYWRNVGSEIWNISGERDTTYDAVMNKARHNREVYCVITDMWGGVVETNVVTITGEPTEELKITQQPTDASAAMGGNYCVTVEAQGDGLTYTWYFKNAGSSVWQKSGVTDNTYDDVMIKSRAGRQVYCVITDIWGNSETTDTVTLICTEEPQAIAMN